MSYVEAGSIDRLAAKLEAGLQAVAEALAGVGAAHQDTAVAALRAQLAAQQAGLVLAQQQIEQQDAVIAQLRAQLQEAQGAGDASALQSGIVEQARQLLSQCRRYLPVDALASDVDAFVSRHMRRPKGT